MRERKTASVKTAQKKRGVAKGHASSLLGTAGGPAGLGDVLLLDARLFRLSRRPLRRVAVTFTQPAAQVDGLAARAAKREFRPLGRALALHDLVANRATYLNH